MKHWLHTTLCTEPASPGWDLTRIPVSALFLFVFNKNLLSHVKETNTRSALSLSLGSLGDQGLHIGDWNNLQAGCPHPAEKGRAAEEKGQRGPGTETGTEWGAQTGQVGQKKQAAYFGCNASDFSYLAGVRHAHGEYFCIWFTLHWLTLLRMKITL